MQTGNRVNEHTEYIIYLCFQYILSQVNKASQVAWMVKNLPANAGDLRDASSIRGSGRYPGGGHGNPL